MGRRSRDKSSVSWSGDAMGDPPIETELPF
jgi:hypothetical protein